MSQEKRGKGKVKKSNHNAAAIERADQLLQEVTDGIDVLLYTQGHEEATEEARHKQEHVPLKEEHHYDEIAGEAEAIPIAHDNDPIEYYGPQIIVSHTEEEAAQDDLPPDHLMDSASPHNSQGYIDDYRHRYKLGTGHEIGVQVGGDVLNKKKSKKGRKKFHHYVEPVENDKGTHYKVHHRPQGHEGRAHSTQQAPNTKLMMKSKRSKLLGYQFDHVA